MSNIRAGVGSGGEALLSSPVEKHTDIAISYVRLLINRFNPYKNSVLLLQASTILNCSQYIYFTTDLILMWDSELWALTNQMSFPMLASHSMSLSHRLSQETAAEHPPLPPSLLSPLCLNSQCYWRRAFTEGLQEGKRGLQAIGRGGKNFTLSESLHLLLSYTKNIFFMWNQLKFDYEYFQCKCGRKTPMTSSSQICTSNCVHLDKTPGSEMLGHGFQNTRD